MARSTVNITKRIAEMKFYESANIIVSTPDGEGVFFGTSHSRKADSVALANVLFGRSVMKSYPLSDISIVKGVA